MTDRFLPVADVDTDPFWQGAREGRLMIQRCPRTGAYQWYPRAHSLTAPHDAPEWVEARGTGTVFSYSVVHHGNGSAPTPYICALIELDECILMFSRLVDVPSDRLKVGLPVQVAFEALADEVMLPVFKERDA